MHPLANAHTSSQMRAHSLLYLVRFDYFVAVFPALLGGACVVWLGTCL